MHQYRDTPHMHFRDHREVASKYDILKHDTLT